MNKSETIVIARHPEIVVLILPQLNMIEIKSEGLVPSDVYRQTVAQAVDEAAKHKLRFWLINNEVSGIIDPEDQIFSNEIIAPRIATETQIQKIACIKPKDFFSGVILENMMDKAKDIFPFRMMFFDNRKDAVRWFQDSSL